MGQTDGVRPRGLSDRLSPTEWQRLRNLQLGYPLRDNPKLGPAGLSDELPAADWQRLRDAQARGLVASIDTARPVRLAAFKASQPTEVDGVVVTAPRKSPPPAPKRPHSGPLRGRPGAAAIVAGALNTIAAGPNTSARIEGKDVPVEGTITRGAGQDLRATARVLGVDVGARGALDPPTARAEIGLSGIVGEKIGLPPHVRVYTTPTGELDIDLSGPVKLGPVVVRRKGVYVIGREDPPRRK